MAAVDAFVRYNERNQIARPDMHFDTYDARVARSALYTSFYDNTVYSSINAFAETLKRDHRLYKHIRGIYNPVYELVELIASAVFGGSLDTETFERGAIPIQTDNPAVLIALRKLWEWSRWDEKKLEYVRLGANLGDVVLKVVDDREKRKVRLEVLHPLKVLDFEQDEVGNVKSYIIQYQRTDDQEYKFVGGKLIKNPNIRYWTYTEVCNEDWFETYRDGYSHALYTNALGEPVSRWENEYGFVPLLVARYQELTDYKWGANAYFAAQPQIHEVNDQASLLNDQIRKVIIPLLFATGITADDQIQKASASEKDEFTILFGPEGSALTPVTAQIDIAAAAQNIQNLLKGALERKLPELSWIRIREEGGNHTAPGIRAATSDAVKRIMAARGQFEAPLVRAHKMAMTIGGLGKYEGFEAFNVTSFDRGELDHQIKPRPVIEDTLSTKERVDTLNAGGAPLWVVMQELGYTDDVIEEVRNEQEASMRADVRTAVNAIFGDTPEGDSDAEQEEQDETQPAQA